MNTQIQFSELPTTYPELVVFHLPRPIHDKVSYQNTVEVIDALAGRKLTADQEDYLDLLSQLVETYETATSPLAKKISGIAALRFLLGENEMTGDDLGRLLGIDRSVAFKILKGRRRLTAEHVKKLSARFRVTSDLFLA